MVTRGVQMQRTVAELLVTGEQVVHEQQCVSIAGCTGADAHIEEEISKTELSEHAVDRNCVMDEYKLQCNVLSFMKIMLFKYKSVLDCLMHLLSQTKKQNKKSNIARTTVTQSNVHLINKYVVLMVVPACNINLKLHLFTVITFTVRYWSSAQHMANVNT